MTWTPDSFHSCSLEICRLMVTLRSYDTSLPHFTAAMQKTCHCFRTFSAQILRFSPWNATTKSKKISKEFPNIAAVKRCRQATNILVWKRGYLEEILDSHTFSRPVREARQKYRRESTEDKTRDRCLRQEVAGKKDRLRRRGMGEGSAESSRKMGKGVRVMGL